MMAAQQVQRIFIPGEAWMYFKIYCGERTSDLLLAETILPLVMQLQERNLIDQWFFIRYHDPDAHIRIRFHSTEAQHQNTVLRLVSESLRTYVDNDIVYKVQMDTYIREIERYGDANIEVSEQLFFYESQFLLQAINLIEDATFYTFFVIKSIDAMLTNFEFSAEQKLKFAIRNRDGFKAEFGGGKHLTKQLDKKYRDLRSDLSQFLEQEKMTDDFEPLQQLLDIHKNQSHSSVAQVLEYLRTSKMNPHQLISSYVHMLVNRAFRSEQRFYELVCYDFLSKYYQMVWQRLKTS